MGDYFGLDRIISIILLIIPFTAWFCGLITRLQERCYVAAILRFFFGGWLLWVIEVILTISNGCNVTVWRLLKI